MNRWTIETYLYFINQGNSCFIQLYYLYSQGNDIVQLVYTGTRELT